MIPLISKPNTEAPNSDYPFGNLRDKSVSLPGTPVNKLVYADIHQFFEKLMDYAGITPNGLPDNEYSGWQLMEALLKGARPYKSFVAQISQSGTNAPTVDQVQEDSIEDLVFGYSTTGVYTITKTGAFPIGKTWVIIGQSDPTAVAIAFRSDNNTIAIGTGGVNSKLAVAPIEIRVYQDL